MPAASPTDAADEVKTMRGDARSGGRPDRGLGALDVDAQQHVRVRGAVGVDARDVIGEGAALHAGREAVLVEHVASGHLGAAPAIAASATSERASPTTSSPRSSSRAASAPPMKPLRP